MKKFFNHKKRINTLLTIMAILIFGQAIVIGKLYSEQTIKNYEVNLVKINTEKDSIDYLKMKSQLTLIDHSVKRLNHFLLTKNIADEKIRSLQEDSISNAVYLAKVSNRYSQYLVDLQHKLQQVPLGMPTSGYISSNFGKRINPIPVLKATEKPKKIEPQTPVEEKDSLGNVISRTVAKASPAKTEATTEPQIQFHKGVDFAVPVGSDVRSTAMGTVIFAGQKGGYGNCVIISHGNGLATLYRHLSQILVETNDAVKVNQIIAKSGNSGRSTGPHLHYEVHKNNTPVNPKLFMSL
ncbi:M23 family metallopeptidase [Bergeyella porcorum]|uniref:M23 family metallopeptidase n=1 Tax=Bergeyella porcorum TaxID=1735111 RepID=UPI0035EB4A2A